MVNPAQTQGEYLWDDPREVNNKANFENGYTWHLREIGYFFVRIEIMDLSGSHHHELFLNRYRIERVEISKPPLYIFTMSSGEKWLIANEGGYSRINMLTGGAMDHESTQEDHIDTLTDDNDPDNRPIRQDGEY